jgi:hypothetical protein
MVWKIDGSAKSWALEEHPAIAGPGKILFSGSGGRADRRPGWIRVKFIKHKN